MTTKTRRTTSPAAAAEVEPVPVEPAAAPANADQGASDPGASDTSDTGTSTPDVASPDAADPGVGDPPDECTAPMDCIVEWCDAPDADGLGVCQPHHEAGWRYVKEEPDRD